MLIFKRFAAKCSPLVRPTLENGLLLCGCALVVYGVRLIYVPAAWILAGVLLALLGLLISSQPAAKATR